MAETDKSYRRRSIENLELELPYCDISLFPNFSSIIGVLVICLIVSLFAPFFPSRYEAYEWTFPTSWNDYYERSRNALILGGIIVGLTLFSRILSNMRRFLDRQLGYKKVGIFKVKNVFYLANHQIAFLNNFHFLSLRQEDYRIGKLEIGQVLKLERTATHKLIDCEIMK